jgi:multidrug efflux system membrane fusion protein
VLKMLAVLAVLAVGTAAVLFAGGRTKGGEATGKSSTAAAVPVTAVTVTRRDVPVYLDGLGTVQAYFMVTVHTQIDGQLSRVAFTEGQDVHKGDLLAEIDPRSYQALVDQALAKKVQDQAKEQQDRAKLSQDQAKKAQDQALVKQTQAKRVQDEIALSNDRVNLKRFEETFATGGSSEQNITDQKAVVAQAEAALQADDATIQANEAAIKSDDAAIQADDAGLQADAAAIKSDEAAIAYARTFLSYTSITSPIDGRVGVRLVDAGNIVHGNDPNGLVVVTQLEPISVLFTLPQQDLVAVNERMAQAKLPVFAVDTTGRTKLDEGVLELVDNQIDPTTGTMRLKATFRNARRRLWPGGFVNVRLELNQRRDAIVVDAPAVQQGPDGTYVYLIKPDQTVEARLVKVVTIQDGQAVIESGLDRGDQVVLTGQDRLKVGMSVSVSQPKDKSAGKPKPAEPKDAPSSPGAAGAAR